MRRLQVAAFTSTVAVTLLLASPAPHALAKGNFIPASWSASVTGPGVGSPIRFHLSGACAPRLTMCYQDGSGSLEAVSFFEGAGFVSGYGGLQQLRRPPVRFPRTSGRDSA